MAVLTAVTVSRSGVTFTPVSAAGGGDSFANAGQQIFYCKNAGVSSVNVTFAVTATVDGLAATNRVVAVAAGAERLIGPFPTGTYNDVNGNVQITYSGVTSVTVGVLIPGQG